MAGAPYITYLCMQAVAAANSPNYLLVGRSDLPIVSLMDTLLPGNVQFSTYWCHGISDGQNTSAPLRIRVKGEGTITAGALVLVCDNRRVEVYNAMLCNSDVNGDILLEQDFPHTNCREWSVILYLAGTNLIVRDLIPENTTVGT
jgi:hypothetical protein